MSADPNKKSSRNFQCRDVLWETFEQMARELECSVDYLINEAMKQYARQRSYGAGASRTPFPGMRGAGEPAMPPPSSHAPAFPSSAPAAPTNPVPPPPQIRANAPLAAPPPSSRLPPPPLRPGSGIGGANLPPPRAPHGGLAPPAPPPRGAHGQATHGGLGPPASTHRSNIPPPSNRSAPPPLPRTATPLPPAPVGANGGFAMGTSGAALSVIYQGDKVSISKDRFVIGRGKQSSDLTLKDPNVSRQHAMIEFQNGVYFMVDMGSTNGVEYNGQRIARKQIAEGDVFKICDHEMRFTYR
ncbi:MAG: FHA domain-containing protein [Polyangiaceae bacterium]